jgi:hypothetical protein
LVGWIRDAGFLNAELHFCAHYRVSRSHPPALPHRLVSLCTSVLSRSIPRDVHLASTSPHKPAQARHSVNGRSAPIAAICRGIFAEQLRPCPAVGARSTTENRGVASWLRPRHFPQRS